MSLYPYLLIRLHTFLLVCLLAYLLTCFHICLPDCHWYLGGSSTYLQTFVLKHLHTESNGRYINYNKPLLSLGRASNHMNSHERSLRPSDHPHRRTGGSRRNILWRGSDDESISESDDDSSFSDDSSSTVDNILPGANELSTRNGDRSINFHRKCGTNVKINQSERVASRVNPDVEFNGAVCLTSRPLRDGEIFEIEVKEAVSRWSGSLEMGVTLIEPNELEFPDTMTDVTYDTWMLSGSTVMKGGSAILRGYGINLDVVVPGNRVGVMRTRNGDLHFYLDGHDGGVAVSDVPPGMYECE